MKHIIDWSRQAPKADENRAKLKTLHSLVGIRAGSATTAIRTHELTTARLAVLFAACISLLYSGAYHGLETTYITATEYQSWRPPSF